MKILVIDDDEILVKGLKRAFSAVGYEVFSCYQGDKAMAALDETLPDVLILDVMLPGVDGLTILRQARDKYPNLPIIMLTARAEDVDKVVGLEMGADDYLAKPFSVRELEARIKAVVRRVAAHNLIKPYETDAQSDDSSPNYVPEARLQMKVGDILMDLSGHRVWKNRMEINLSPREFEVLAALLKNRGMVFTRDKLLELCWGYDYLGGSRAVDILISRLREKIEDDPENPRIILTKRGVGYYCGG